MGGKWGQLGRGGLTGLVVPCACNFPLLPPLMSVEKKDGT